LLGGVGTVWWGEPGDLSQSQFEAKGDNVLLDEIAAGPLVEDGR